MKRHLFLQLLILNCISSATVAWASCTVRETANAIKLTTESGDTTTIEFSLHENRESQIRFLKRLNKIDRRKPGSASDPGFLDQVLYRRSIRNAVDEFVGKNEHVSSRVEGDSEQTQARIRSGGLAWVGLEVVAGGIDVQQDRESYARAARLMKAADIPDSKRDQALRLMFGADHYAHFNSHKEEVKLVALDDEPNRGEMHSQILKSIDIQLSEFKKVLKPNDYQMLVRQVDSPHVEIGTGMVDPSIDYLIRENSANIELVSRLRRFKLRLEEQTQILSSRDKVIAKNILAQKGPGYARYGSAHKPGILRELKKSCSTRGNLIREADAETSSGKPN